SALPFHAEAPPPKALTIPLAGFSDRAALLADVTETRRTSAAATKVKQCLDLISQEVLPPDSQNCFSSSNATIIEALTKLGPRERLALLSVAIVSGKSVVLDAGPILIVFCVTSDGSGYQFIVSGGDTLDSMRLRNPFDETTLKQLFR